MPTLVYSAIKTETEAFSLLLSVVRTPLNVFRVSFVDKQKREMTISHSAVQKLNLFKRA